MRLEKGGPNVLCAVQAQSLHTKVDILVILEAEQPIRVGAHGHFILETHHFTLLTCRTRQDATIPLPRYVQGPQAGAPVESSTTLRDLLVVLPGSPSLLPLFDSTLPFTSRRVSILPRPNPRTMRPRRKPCVCLLYQYLSDSSAFLQWASVPLLQSDLLRREIPLLPLMDYLLFL